MKKENKFLRKIPVWLSSNISIFIYLFLFFYLVIFAAICLFTPSLNHLAPSEDIQLIFGNYTNVLSALGASIAAGSGVAIHGKMKKLHQSHEDLKDSIDDLHQKIDKIASGQKSGQK